MHVNIFVEIEISSVINSSELPVPEMYSNCHCEIIKRRVNSGLTGTTASTVS